MQNGVIRTGLVYVGGYAKKVRRVVNAVFIGQFNSKYINDKITELNKNLFEVIAERGYDKRDVINIEIPYEIDENGLKWIYSEIKIKYWKQYSEDKPFDEEITNMDTRYAKEEIKEENVDAEEPKDEESKKDLGVKVGTTLESFLK